MQAAGIRNKSLPSSGTVPGLIAQLSIEAGVPPNEPCCIIAVPLMYCLYSYRAASAVSNRAHHDELPTGENPRPLPIQRRRFGRCRAKLQNCHFTSILTGLSANDSQVPSQNSSALAPFLRRASVDASTSSPPSSAAPFEATAPFDDARRIKMSIRVPF